VESGSGGSAGFSARSRGNRQSEGVVLLFHSEQTIPLERLRRSARGEVRRSPLILRVAAGAPIAAQALHNGFWPFVSEFERAIDRRRLPRSPLRKRYPATFDEVFGGLTQAVRDMRREEGSHAQHWRQNARLLGIAELGSVALPGVQRLIDSAYDRNLSRFFAVLAGTELIAEELSAFLVYSSAFTELFDDKRWSWGDVHLLPHENGPSHLDIDVDLARAYGGTGSDRVIENAIAETITLFGQAANEVDERLGGAGGR
jgi:hypothetical protein